MNKHPITNKIMETSKEQEAREAWLERFKLNPWYEAEEMVQGVTMFQSRLLEELEKRKLKLRTALQQTGIDALSTENRAVFFGSLEDVKEIIELVKTLKP